MTNRRVLIFFLALLFLVPCAAPVQAQFWKKKTSKTKKHTKKRKKESVASTTMAQDSIAEPDTTASVPEKSKKELRREKRAKKRQARHERKEKARQERLARKNGVDKKAQTPDDDGENPTIKKWADINYVPTTKKSGYRIDVLAPMYLDELVKNGYAAKDIPEKAIPGLSFYKGVQIAADTLKKAGFELEIYVHDVSSLLESAEMLVNKNMMDSADLILGAVLSKDVAILANYARAKHINFVSALSTADGFEKDNPYFTILQPSLRSWNDWIVGELEDQPKGTKALVIYPNADAANNEALKVLKSEKGYQKRYHMVPTTGMPEKDSIARWVDTAGTINVILPYNNLASADTMVEWLHENFPGTRLHVLGMPTWAQRQWVRKDWTNITIDIPEPFVYNPNTTNVKYVNKVFKREYGGKINDKVYLGYEALIWYANLLSRYGTIFNKQYSDNETTPFTPFLVKPRWDSKGNANYHENRYFFKQTLPNAVGAKKEAP